MPNKSLLKNFWFLQEWAMAPVILPHWKYLYFDIMVGLVWSNDLMSYAGSSVATGMVTHAG